MAGSKAFQIVGFQNSGKTTLMKKMIFNGTKNGLRIGTIKHHGHGGVPEKTVLNKDTDKHRNAGAQITSVEGNGSLHIEANKNSWDLEEIIHVYKNFSMDLILIEGYKHASYPKVVIIRNDDDLYLLEKLVNIKAVISWVPITSHNAYEIFLIDDLDLFVKVFYKGIFENLEVVP
ncbi:molybdopterin-guanine dinucleotide biosynthesis protein B [Lederbergia citrea]|uniref:Molybdopterin-guanine dinucleotide biosynthesis protein B n=1 Tax=Lederbergia citrea TaxID=2833581 RepID=A0A942ULN5_9BACI|nr:molybdopterin-guanine dinucleotide biosynthesis protein B [Lederbergia citrea]MBS4222037.1 molybdopterin-guanine dinucleotide biosynthesis protein B [Lederbergia citrea]